ncbi:MAG: glucose-6-phosphate dehydrogenase [Gemmatimonadota bacterium]
MTASTTAHPEATSALGRLPQAPPCAMVLFGANGDLSHRLVVPALYNLARAKRLSDDFRLFGVDRASDETGGWIQSLREGLERFATDSSASESDEVDPDVWGWLASRMTYVQADLTESDSYIRLRDRLADVDRAAGSPQNRLYYLAVVDRLFGGIVDQLGAAGLTRQEERAWRRVIIEKPLGHDLDSAKALNAKLSATLQEDQIFRIDHFLGKETVQNILALRFANGLFEPVWNRDHIDQVQVTVAETVGVEHRAAFYERTGALRDMVPNHLFQLLSLMAMEPPTSFRADPIRDRKTELLQMVRLPAMEGPSPDVVRGQYGAGSVLGAPFRAYRAEPGVAADSPVETYVAARLFVENWRWAGVPFYLRTGKALARRWTEIAIRFRDAPVALLRSCDLQGSVPNWLVLRIQPDEGLSLEFGAKRPGPRLELGAVQMDFDYRRYFHSPPATGYETLLYDCMIGDATLFQRGDTVEAAWQVVQPVLDAWSERMPTGFPDYTAGSDGPTSGDALLARDGHAWRALP